MRRNSWCERRKPPFSININELNSFANHFSKLPKKIFFNLIKSSFYRIRIYSIIFSSFTTFFGYGWGKWKWNAMMIFFLSLWCRKGWRVKKRYSRSYCLRLGLIIALIEWEILWIFPRKTRAVCEWRGWNLFYFLRNNSSDVWGDIMWCFLKAFIATLRFTLAPDRNYSSILNF